MYTHEVIIELIQNYTASSSLMPDFWCTGYRAILHAINLFASVFLNAVITTCGAEVRAHLYSCPRWRFDIQHSVHHSMVH